MTGPLVEGAGVALAYEQAGEGPAVVLVAGLAGRGPLPTIPGARVIAYDRRGHGASGEPEAYTRTTVAEQAQDLAALLVGLGAAPAVLVGEGLGALIALDLARREPPLVAGIVAVDAPLLAFVPAGSEVLAAEREELEGDLRAGGPAAAVRAHLTGRGVDPARAERVAARPRAFFADYGAQATLEATRRELRALRVPLVVVDSAGAPAHLREAGDALAGVVPGATRAPAGDPARAAGELLGT